MRYIVSFSTSIIVFLALVQSSSSTLETRALIQNRNTVQSLYGSPVREVYRTSHDLMVTASFASNGNLCRARIHSDGGGGITDTELNPVLDELVPKNVRGEFKIGTFLNITCLKVQEPERSASNSSRKPAPKVVVDPCAECSGVSEDYERVNITKYGNTNQYRSVHVTFQRPECEGPDKVRQ
jgi:hypothetical protein